ncbi:MAG: hypothetical protein KZQ99_01590, partial [Candidatus Thiodiazotropha sp. (ex Dulcina madagascariensis)]|nr:hypothetical protein [Candidatus Thiodiazotropha sp. (ex Dulcina madagascariensis)]
GLEFFLVHHAYLPVLGNDKQIHNLIYSLADRHHVVSSDCFYCHNVYYDPRTCRYVIDFQALPLIELGNFHLTTPSG